MPFLAPGKKPRVKAVMRSRDTSVLNDLETGLLQHFLISRLDEVRSVTLHLLFQLTYL